MRGLAVLTLTALLCGSATAGMAEHARRGKTAAIDLVTYRTNVKDVVVITGALPAGDAMAGTGNIAVPTLAGMMLDRGTKLQDQFAISDKLESLGAEVSFEVGVQSLGVRAKCLRKDLATVLAIIAEELRMPAFKVEEFEKARAQFVGGLQNSTQDTGARAHEAFSRSIYPADHPNHVHTVQEYVAAAKAASLDEVKAFHGRYYGPASFTLVLAGDIVDADARRAVGKAFAAWSGGQRYLEPAQPAGRNAAREISVPLAEKPSISVILGQATGLRYRDPDALALRVGTAILGHGFTSRLMSSVRDREGLTYGIGASVNEDTITDGSFDISATFAPTLLDKGLASTRRELDKWWRDGVTDQELNARKDGLIGTYQVSLATTGGIAGAILTDIQRGLPLSWLDEYPKAVRALTAAKVNAAIRAHVDPAAMVLVEAGSVSPKGS